MSNTPQKEQKHPHHFQQNHESYFCNSDEIDLVDLVAVLWRRRSLILLCTLICLALGGLYLFLATPQYKITAQIRPGITGYGKNGEPKYGLKPQDIKIWFDKGAYTVSFLKKEFSKKAQLPKIKAFISKNSNVITVNFFSPHPKEGENILQVAIDGLINSGSKGLKRSLTVSKSEIEKQIARKEAQIKLLHLEQKRLTEDIKKEKRKIRVVKADIKVTTQKQEQIKQLIDSIKGQIGTINKNTQELIKLRNSLLNVKGEQLSLLMYSNIIQQNINYVTVLWQRLTDLKNQMESLGLSKVSKEVKIKNLEQTIKNIELKRDKEIPLDIANYQKAIETLTTRLNSLSPVEMVQYPFSSVMPVKPAKKKILALTLVLGFVLSIVFAFFYEFWIQNRDKIARI